MMPLNACKPFLYTWVLLLTRLRIWSLCSEKALFHDKALPVKSQVERKCPEIHLTSQHNLFVNVAFVFKNSLNAALVFVYARSFARKLELFTKMAQARAKVVEAINVSKKTGNFVSVGHIASPSVSILSHICDSNARAFLGENAR